ncbi:MAG TPA: fused MFS/spermidine synthase [Myxococcota bacterium]|nr:fused MFS/spermidine synthase [Myxococcota bacterium]
MVRPISLLLTVLTGFSGLVYEVAWQKYLATLLGSHSEATAAVLAIFLGGMALGYELFGRVARRVSERAGAHELPALLRTYGVVEAGIGLWALAFPWLFGAAQRVSFLVPPGHEALSFAFDVLLSALLLGPPTVLMGGTIPLLTQALSRTVAESTRVHAWIYATNTAGAFAGALAGGFALVPWLGLDGVLRAMGAVNLAAGATFIALEVLRRRSASSASVSAIAGELGSGSASAGGSGGPGNPHGASPRLASYAAIAFLGGFAMMALQTVANRIGALSLGSSHFTFAMIAALFVLCIALGSFAVASLSRIPRALIVASQWALVGLVLALYFAVPNAPYAAHVVRSVFRDVPQAFGPYYAATFLALLALLAIPISLSGALLPLLFHHLRDRHGDLGRIAGRLYSANTVGSLAGALLGGYVLLFWLDLDDVYRVALAALALGAALVTANVLGVSLRRAGAACLAVLAAAVFLPSWRPSDLTAGAFRQRQPALESYQGARAFYAAEARGTKLLFHRDDPVSTITVIEAPYQGRRTRSIINNGKSDGNTSIDYATMCYAALVPALLADDVRNSFVIGWGTGISAGELARLADSKLVRAAEISPGVIEAAPLFDPWNLGAHANEKVVLERRDAYRALLHTQERYGVILSEPSNPWVTGVEMLFSREFLEAARARLTPGGVYGQWIHGYESDARTLALVMQTYATVFERVSVWFTRQNEVLLLGFNSADSAPDVAALRARYDRPDYRAGVARCGAQSWDELAAHELIPAGVIAPEPGRKIHTLRHPILSDTAARAFYSGGEVDLPTLAGRLSDPDARPRGLLAERAPELDEAGLRTITRHVCGNSRRTECATWHAYWEHRFPASSLRAATWRETQAMFGANPAGGPALVARLAAFYRGEPPPFGKVTPVQRARLATALFARHFVHAIPFPREGLRRAWAGCERGLNALDCLDARRHADAQLSSLEAPPAS